MWKSVLAVCCLYLAVDSKFVARRDSDCDEPIDCTDYLYDFLNGLTYYLNDFADTDEIEEYCSYPIDECSAELRPDCEDPIASAESLSTAFHFICSDEGREAMFQLGQSKCGAEQDNVVNVVEGIIDCTVDFEKRFNPYIDAVYDTGADLDAGKVCPLFSDLEKCLEKQFSGPCGGSLQIPVKVSELASDYVDCGEDVDFRDVEPQAL